MANPFQWAAKSATNLGPLDAIFAVNDYMVGKDEGEDDIRAVGGAVSSTAGGLGGALAGASAGALLGPVGAIGGALIGGALGDFTGGWAFDRADETVRGNAGKKQAKNKASSYLNQSNTGNNMATFVGLNPQGQPIFSNESVYEPQLNQPDAGDFLTGAAALTGAGLLGKRALDRGLIPRTNAAFKRVPQHFESAKLAGLNNFGAAKAATQQLGETGLRKGASFAKNIPLAGKLAAGALLLKTADDLTGNNLWRGATGLADAATGNAFDLDRQNQKTAADTTYPVQNQPSFDDRRRMIQEMADEQLRKATAIEQYKYERDLKNSWEKGIAGLQAQQARDLMEAYTSTIPNSVAQSMQSISNFRL